MPPDKRAPDPYRPARKQLMLGEGEILPIILLAVAGLGGYLLLRLLADDEDWQALVDLQAELEAHGDVPRIPVEAKFGGPVNRKAGGVSRGTARTADTRTHHNRPARTQDKGAQ